MKNLHKTRKNNAARNCLVVESSPMKKKLKKIIVLGFICSISCSAIAATDNTLKVLKKSLVPTSIGVNTDKTINGVPGKKVDFKSISQLLMMNLGTGSSGGGDAFVCMEKIFFGLLPKKRVVYLADTFNTLYDQSRKFKYYYLEQTVEKHLDDIISSKLITREDLEDALFAKTEIDYRDVFDGLPELDDDGILDTDLPEGCVKKQIAIQYFLKDGRSIVLVDEDLVSDMKSNLEIALLRIHEAKINKFYSDNNEVYNTTPVRENVAKIAAIYPYEKLDASNKIHILTFVFLKDFMNSDEAKKIRFITAANYKIRHLALKWGDGIPSNGEVAEWLVQSMDQFFIANGAERITDYYKAISALKKMIQNPEATFLSLAKVVDDQYEF
ncbi:MAG: hypothetical protein A2202_02535 [Bdellovibrionales bacterium RIFOXYA1_FULL_36_14]|nr:MAG: hypothetical protein A2202_02535 [Bdellovibrionales bacterium RIFOXYA1_FULL_36_14]